MNGWAETPLIDPAQLAGYVELLPAEQVAALVRAFERELNTRPALIADLVAAGDIAAARGAAHRLKGASLTIGAGRLAALADAIELAAPADLPALAAALPSVARDTEAVIPPLANPD